VTMALVAAALRRLLCSRSHSNIVAATTPAGAAPPGAPACAGFLQTTELDRGDEGI
jgi:hypothetical protein